MQADLVECLRCGCQRTLKAGAHDAGECPRCRYVGWAPAAALSEPVRRALRDRPLEARGRHVTAA